MLLGKLFFFYLLPKRMTVNSLGVLTGSETLKNVPKKPVTVLPVFQEKTAQRNKRTLVMWSKFSYMTMMSFMSFMSVFAAMSVFSVASVLSIGSATSALSAGSVNSVLSVASINSILSIVCVNENMKICFDM